MSRIRVWAAALILSAGSIGAVAGRIDSTAPPCTGGTLQSYINLGGGGCSGPGNLTYFDFGFSVLSGTTALASELADASLITVTPPLNLGDQVIFNSNFFSVGSGRRAIYQIDYTIDPPPDILPGFDLELYTFTPVSPGKATVTAAVCVGGNIGLPCMPVQGASNFELIPYILQVFHNGLPLGSVQLSDSVSFASPTNYIDVRIIIELDAKDGGSSSIDGFGGRVPAPQEIPEPGTWAMLGAGFIGLGLARRARRA